MFTFKEHDIILIHFTVNCKATIQNESNTKDDSR